MSWYRFICSLGLSLLLGTCLASRSMYRPLDPRIPEIIVRWVDDKQEHRLKSIYLEESALFKTFNRPHFFEHQLPQGKISYRNEPKKKVKGSRLAKLTESLLTEIYQRKTEFTDFEVLKQDDFNAETASGYIVLKFKKYPFVLKLSIETPESFVKPFSKGWKQSVFFIMGGANGHCCGFTRIANLEKISEMIKNEPYWSTLVDTPRKWFLLPSKSRWFEVRSRNIGPKGEQSVELPAVYGVIADAISSDKNFSLFDAEHRALALKLARFLGNRIDAHIDNFMREKDTKKILIVDTERFDRKIGLKHPLYFESYPSWYFQLTVKAFKDLFFRSKRYRRSMQLNPPGEFIET